MTIVAEFHPPDALLRFEAWKAAHEQELASIPADEVQIQTGRATPSKRTFVAEAARSNRAGRIAEQRGGPTGGAGLPP